MDLLLMIFVHFLFSGANGALDNSGTEFAVVFMENPLLPEQLGYVPNIDKLLFIATQSDDDVYVNVTSPKSPGTVDERNLVMTKGTVINVTISHDLEMSEDSTVSDKGVYISSTAEIVVYALNKEFLTADGFLVLPIDSLGTENMVVGAEPTMGNFAFCVVAAYDNTTVSYSNVTSNETVTFTLDSFQTYQVSDAIDLTGLELVSNNPIGLFSGSTRQSISVTNPITASSDHLVEHVPPTKTWGKEFVTAPLMERTAGDIIRIVSGADDNSMSLNCSGNNSIVDSFTLNKGGVREIDTNTTPVYCHIVCSEPSLVILFSKSAAADGVDTDPFMTIIPPIEQYDSRYTFATAKSAFAVAGPYQQMINVIIKTNDISGLLLDGEALSGVDWFDLDADGTSYSIMQYEVVDGTHTLYHTNPTVSFAFMIHGLVKYESYGYTGGQRLAPIALPCTPTPTIPGDGIDNDCDGRIDEELYTASSPFDDDGDGLVDEDVAQNYCYNASDCEVIDIALFTTTSASDTTTMADTTTVVDTTTEADTTTMADTTTAADTTTEADTTMMADTTTEADTTTMADTTTVADTTTMAVTTTTADTTTMVDTTVIDTTVAATTTDVDGPITSTADGPTSTTAAGPTNTTSAGSTTITAAGSTAAGSTTTTGNGPTGASTTMNTAAGPSPADPTTTAGVGPTAAGPTTTTSASPSAASATTTTVAGPTSPGTSMTTSAGLTAVPTTSTAASPTAAGPTTTTATPTAAGPIATGPTTTTAAGPTATGPTTTTAAGPTAAGPTTTTAAGPTAAGASTTTGTGPTAADPTTTTTTGPTAADPTTTTAAGPIAAGPTTTTAAGPIAAGPTTTTATGPTAAGPTTTTAAGPSAAGPSTTSTAGPTAAGPTTTTTATGPTAAGPTTTTAAGPAAAGPTTTTTTAAGPTAAGPTTTAAGPNASGPTTTTDAGPTAAGSTTTAAGVTAAGPTTTTGPTVAGPMTTTTTGPTVSGSTSTLMELVETTSSLPSNATSLTTTNSSLNGFDFQGASEDIPDEVKVAVGVTIPTIILAIAGCTVAAWFIFKRRKRQQGTVEPEVDAAVAGAVTGATAAAAGAVRGATAATAGSAPTAASSGTAGDLPAALEESKVRQASAVSRTPTITSKTPTAQNTLMPNNTDPGLPMSSSRPTTATNLTPSGGSRAPSPTSHQPSPASRPTSASTPKPPTPAPDTPPSPKTNSWMEDENDTSNGNSIEQTKANGENVDVKENDSGVDGGDSQTDSTSKGGDVTIDDLPEVSTDL